MTRNRTISLAAVALLALAAAASAEAREPRCKSTRSCGRDQCAQNWHGGYYHTAWGMPAVQLVPPTADYQTHWGWGVGNTRITPICPQFARPWPGVPHYDRRGFRPTPPWPSDTDQFGAYYVRGPW